jgi:DNA mismatch repair ATPase MutL
LRSRPSVEISFVLGAIPDWLNEARAEQFVRDLIDQLRISGALKVNKLSNWHIVAKLAVQNSYRRNQPRSIEELKRFALTIASL